MRQQTNDCPAAGIFLSFTERTAMTSPIRMRIPRTISLRHSVRSNGVASLAMLALGVLALAGCSSGSSSSNLAVGAITFTDVNGTATPKPPTSLTAGQGTYLDVALTGDAQQLGADWSVYCGSAPAPGTPLPPGQTQDQSCGTFTPVHTTSGPIPSYVTNGTGYVTLYTAPAATPKNGTVTLYASATSNPSRSSNVTLTINGLPISVGFAPAPPATLATGATAQFRALLNNDTSNAGVSWSVICGASDCGSFNPAKTTSGVVTTFTAPAAVPSGGTVQVVATSVTDPTKAATATISITAAAAGSVVSGTVKAGQQAISGAQVTLYAAATSETSPHAGTGASVSSVITEATDENGNFALPASAACSAADSQVYLVATGGDAGGGVNPDLALISALGSCTQLKASPVVVNEVTTVAAVYALSGFMIDEAHIGSTQTSPQGVSAAFATARDLVDISSGEVRATTVTGTGIVPRHKVNMIANLLNACARTGGSLRGDMSNCDRLFRATNPVASLQPQTSNTVRALLNLARNATDISERPDSSALLYQLASSSDAFGPALSAKPRDWTLAVRYPVSAKSRAVVDAQRSQTNRQTSRDAAGNLWIPSDGDAVTEYIGGALLAAPRTGISNALDPGSAP